MTARTHASDENLGVESVALHPDPVAKDRPTRKGRIRVRGDHSHRLVLLPAQRDERIHEGRLASPWRAGESHDRSGGILPLRRSFQGANRWVTTLNEADGSGKRTDVAGAKPGGQ